MPLIAGFGMLIHTKSRRTSIEKWYGGAHGGFHKMYIVEIENIYSR